MPALLGQRRAPHVDACGHRAALPRFFFTEFCAAAATSAKQEHTDRVRGEHGRKDWRWNPFSRNLHRARSVMTCSPINLFHLQKTGACVNSRARTLEVSNALSLVSLVKDLACFKRDLDCGYHRGLHNLLQETFREELFSCKPTALLLRRRRPLQRI